MTGDLIINGIDAYTTWGMTLPTGGRSALMTPPALKERVSNSSRLQHGIRPANSPVKMQERSITLSLQFSAPTAELFLSAYASFCEQLMTGKLNITIKEQPNVEYKMQYNSCSQYQEFMMGIAKFTLRLTETDPSDRDLDVNA